MTDRLKTILIATGFTVVVVAMGFALYLVFFRSTPTSPETPSESGAAEETPGLLPESTTGTATRVTEGADDGLPEVDTIARGGVTETTDLTTTRVDTTTVGARGSSVNFYDASDQRFYTVGADGEVVSLSNQRFPNVESVTWNTSGDKAIIEFPDGANVVYHFDTGTQVSLPTHWEDFGFSPRTDEVIAKSIGIDPSNRALVITNADGSNARAIAPLGENADKVHVSWSPNNAVVAFSETGPEVGSLGRTLIVPIGKNQENLKGLTVEGFDFRPQWNTTGDKIVYSAVGSINGYRPLLWVVDGSPNSLGENRRSLGIETWADKCTFASAQTMYCAVPQNLPPNTGLQRAVGNETPDRIFRVNIATGTSELIAIPDEPQPIGQIQVSSDQSTLFFTNAQTGILQRLQLK